MLLNSFQVPFAIGFLVSRIVFLRVVGQVRSHKLGSPYEDSSMADRERLRRRTVDHNVSDQVDKVLLFFVLAVIPIEEPGEMAKHSVTLGKNTLTELDNGNVGCWIHLRELVALRLWILIKGVALVDYQHR